MEISLVRKRLSDTLERARRQAAERRARSDQASRDFDLFLQKIAVPLFRQVANALKAEGYAFTVFTPSGSVRLMSDRSASDFVELTLDTSDNPPRVIGQVSRERGRRVLDTERAIGAPDALTEEQLLDFLMKELEAFVER
jgi:GAF domain-containing protein